MRLYADGSFSREVGAGASSLSWEVGRWISTHEAHATPSGQVVLNYVQLADAEGWNAMDSPRFEIKGKAAELFYFLDGEGPEALVRFQRLGEAPGAPPN